MSAENVWKDDFMDRAPSAKFLTEYILKNPHIKVLNVNSPWGSGKSFFLERWARSLETQHVCVRFNAWETDYTKEPLVALIACLEQQVIDNTALESTKIGQGIINTGSELVKKSAPLILKGLVKKFTGVELDELLVSGAEDTLDEVVGGLLKDQASTERDVSEFKVAVTNRLKNAAENKCLSGPAFVFIDELDRCRPTYAIELLERIKHFFELPDCRFIIASDSEQLAHAIRAVYGQGFSSEKYLNRFFDAEFVLDNDDVYAFVQAHLPEISSLTLGVNITGQTGGIWHEMGRGDPVNPRGGTVTSSRTNFTENAIIIVGLIQFFSVALREVLNYLKQIKSAADTIGTEIDFFWLAFLVFFKNSKSNQYPLIFDVVNGGKALSSYCSAQRSVNFSFTYSLATIAEIAGFYQMIITATREDYQKMGPVLKDWQAEIYRNNRGEARKLKSYRKIVDLAHRLT